MKLAYWMYEGTALSGIARVAGSMQRVHTVIHGPRGDGYINVMFSMLERFHEIPPFTLSPIGQREMAQGSRARLVETVRRVERDHQPDVIVITPTCSSTLLQEDIGSVARTLGKETKAKIIVPQVNAFRDLEHETMDAFLTQLVGTLVEEQPKTERFSVNLIGPSYLGFHQLHDLTEIRRLLADVGVEIDAVVPYGATVEDLRTLTRAHMNVCLYREYGVELCRMLEKQYNMPYTTITPIGLRQTAKFLQAIGQQAQIDVKPYIAKQISPAGPLSRFVKSVDSLSALYGKRAVVFGDYSHAVGVTHMLCEIGITVLWAGTYMKGLEAEFKEAVAGLTEEAFVEDDFQKLSHKIRDTAPDVVFGTQMERHSSKRFQLPCVVISAPAHILNFPIFPEPIVAYQGMAQILETINRTIRLGLEEHLVKMFGEEEPMGEATAPAAQAAAEVAATTTTDQPAPLSPGGMPWEAEAVEVLKQIPFFVRSKVQKNTETFASERGHSVITAEVLYAAKTHFSKS
ncbi:ferredoxin:protochlorophyllide reductase (ATP-dependent) subunit B [Heliophilum fasciatum]|uniref:Ferredoxin protochlorophyllide reductase subunit B n=1 Tax=Heliophilum fasciatum TaxID=35700 RepID=A0A4R2RVI8_9FIRM|nr:ferredoxin:protochlorophyllide reductase (ATP-dependent) subunit B [Heliophilum fasciatum]MCW2277054.1 light-independent protochlorophyllide reductase subunit B [Heliophilum fasciatum]TCP68420.1 ferredoxin protochlorophyllide reductase subunit B [Heliophilum fasciatum]